MAFRESPEFNRGFKIYAGSNEAIGELGLNLMNLRNGPQMSYGLELWIFVVAEEPSFLSSNPVKQHVKANLKPTSAHPNSFYTSANVNVPSPLTS